MLWKIDGLDEKNPQIIIRLRHHNEHAPLNVIAIDDDDDIKCVLVSVELHHWFHHDAYNTECFRDYNTKKFFQRFSMRFFNFKRATIHTTFL